MFRKKIFSLVFIIFCLLGSSALARTAFDASRLDAFVERMMRAYDIPGVGLAVVENGEISYLQGYGVRDVTTGTPVTPDTQFAVGSVTKSFTALGMMILVEEGRVDLDEPVTTYLPEFRLADPAATRSVTVRHVLSHTTGLVRTDASTFDPTITAEQVVRSAADTPLVGKPGEQFVYSNVNTTIAGAIIERVAGTSWEAFTRERVLEPLGMTTATLSIPELEKQPNRARPHELDVLRGLKPTGYLTLRADAAAGAVNASASDMARYVRFQVGGGPAFLSQASLNEMHGAQIVAPDFNLPGTLAAQARSVAEIPKRVPASLITDEHYGLYWGVERFLGEKLVQHGGNTTGFTANVTLLPERRSGIVVLANADGANIFMEALRLHVAELLLGRAGPDVHGTLQAQLKVLGQDNASRRRDLLAARHYEPDREELTALAGTYEGLADSELSKVEVSKGGKLTLTSGFQKVRFSVELLPLGGDRFLSADSPLVGAVVQFVQKDKRRTIELETLMGRLPLAVADIRSSD